MAKAEFTYSITGPRATVELNEWYTKKYGVPEGKHECTVIGLFQFTDEDCAMPVYVIVLNSGQSIDVPVEKVKFLEVPK